MITTTHIMVILTGLLVMMIIGFGLLWQVLARLLREVEFMAVAGMPSPGYPDHIEACWEDIGAHGRWLTELGGMSIKMREQQYEEFIKALNTPLTGSPAAGSPADILMDLDRYMTRYDAVRERWGKQWSEQDYALVPWGEEDDINLPWLEAKSKELMRCEYPDCDERATLVHPVNGQLCHWHQFRAKQDGHWGDSDEHPR